MDSKELPGNSEFLDKNPVLNPLKTEAPELSYLFDFIDIDESGQVNLEELQAEHLEMCCFLYNTVFATLSCFSLQGNSLLGNRLWGKGCFFGGI